MKHQTRLLGSKLSIPKVTTLEMLKEANERRLTILSYKLLDKRIRVMGHLDEFGVLNVARSGTLVVVAGQYQAFKETATYVDKFSGDVFHIKIPAVGYTPRGKMIDISKRRLGDVVFVINHGFDETGNPLIAIQGSGGEYVINVNMEKLVAIPTRNGGDTLGPEPYLYSDDFSPILQNEGYMGFLVAGDVKAAVASGDILMADYAKNEGINMAEGLEPNLSTFFHDSKYRFDFLRVQISPLLPLPAIAANILPPDKLDKGQ